MMISMFENGFEIEEEEKETVEETVYLYTCGADAKAMAAGEADAAGAERLLGIWRALVRGPL